MHGANLLFVPSGNLTDNQFTNWTLRAEAVPGSGRASHASFTLQDRKGNIWVYRGPNKTGDRSYMRMQFYYKTLPGFFFPKNKDGAVLDANNQPAVGTITPYLRSLDSNGAFFGDPISGSADGLTDNNNALEINYNPKWPDSTPVLQRAETLTVLLRPGTGARPEQPEILYQQSMISTRTMSRCGCTIRPAKVFALGPTVGLISWEATDSVKNLRLQRQDLVSAAAAASGPTLFLDSAAE